MARRQHITLMVALVICGLLTLSWIMSGTSTARYPKAELLNRPDAKTDIVKEQSKVASGDGGLSTSILTGGSIAPKLENATAKYADTLPLCSYVHWISPTSVLRANKPFSPKLEQNSAAPPGSSSTR